MKTMSINLPKCECGCEGDLILKITDGIIEFTICDCCGKKFNPKEIMIEEDE